MSLVVLAKTTIMFDLKLSNTNGEITLKQWVSLVPLYIASAVFKVVSSPSASTSP